MEVTKDLYSLNLLAKLMVKTLAIAAIAEANLMQTAAGQCHPGTGLFPDA